MDGLITFESERMVHLVSRFWVSLKTFRIEPDTPESDLLTALLAHPQYRDHYAGGTPDEQGEHQLHGPYRLECITTDTFHRITPHAAEHLLREWANPASGSGSHTVREDLERWVYPVVTGRDVFVLPDLRPDAEHDWGWVVGGLNGFHELIVIDRTDHRMTLVVASDD